MELCIFIFLLVGFYGPVKTILLTYSQSDTMVATKKFKLVSEQKAPQSGDGGWAGGSCLKHPQLNKLVKQSTC